jgi:hypothetical protein
LDPKPPHELLDRTLVHNPAQLLHALREYERRYHAHRPIEASHARGAAIGTRPDHKTTELARLDTWRRDRLGGIIHEHKQAARAHGHLSTVRAGPQADGVCGSVAGAGGCRVRPEVVVAVVSAAVSLMGGGRRPSVRSCTGHCGHRRQSSDNGAHEEHTWIV